MKYFLCYYLRKERDIMINKFLKENRSGVVNCLGWCNKSFNSPDKINVRFCKKCSEKKEAEIKRTNMKSKKSSLDVHDD